MSKVNWPAVAGKLHVESNNASINRRNLPLPISIVTELEQLGISSPSGPDNQQTKALTEQERQLLELQRNDVGQALRLSAKTDQSIKKLFSVLRKIGRNYSIPEGTRLSLIESIADKIDTLKVSLLETMQSSPEKFLAINSAYLRRLVKQLAQGRIAITKYVQDKIDDITQKLGAGKVVFLHGETGTGKTEVAKIAAKRFSGKDAVVVRGYAGMDASELFGHMTLTSERLSQVDKINSLVEARIALLMKVTPNATEHDRSELVKNLLSQNGVTVTEYILGAVYKCAKEGKILILDEANYIPPTLLANLNDILTKRVGEFINVQEDGVEPIQVQEGWGLILTGNINPDPSNPRYQGRLDFDLAFRDRIKPIEYNYLPQATDGDPKDHAHENKQLFTVAIAALLARYRSDPKIDPASKILESIENRHGALYLPGGEKGLDIVWRLCKLAAVTQMAFDGKVKDGSNFGYNKNGVSVGYQPDIYLSPRVLMDVLQSWKSDGYRYQIDYYLGEALLDRATKTDDKAYFFQIAKFFGFFKSKEWKTVGQAYSNGIKATTPNRDELKSEQKYTPKFVPGREVLQAVFNKVPERKIWPDGESGKKQRAQSSAAELLALKTSFEKVTSQIRDTLGQYVFDPNDGK